MNKTHPIFLSDTPNLDADDDGLEVEYEDGDDIPGSDNEDEAAQPDAAPDEQNRNAKMSKLGEMAEGQHIFWIDRNNFIHGDLAYQVDETAPRGRNGRIRGFHYWRCNNDVIKATVLTEGGVADSRPQAAHDEKRVTLREARDLALKVSRDTDERLAAERKRDAAPDELAQANTYATPPLAVYEEVRRLGAALGLERQRNAELEARLAEAQRLLESARRECGEWRRRRDLAVIRAEEAEEREDETEARLAAIDAALDDADAPDATEAHALDNDPIIERIKLWRHVDAEMQAQLAEANEALEYKVEIAPDDLLATMLARAQEAEAQIADLPLLRRELERLRTSIGPQTCDIHAAFSAGCLNCRLAQREAQLAEANAQINAIFENMKAQAVLVATLRAALEAVEWSGFACPSCYAAEEHGHKPDCALQAALNPRGEGEK